MGDWFNGSTTMLDGSAHSPDLSNLKASKLLLEAKVAMFLLSMARGLQVKLNQLTAKSSRQKLTYARRNLSICQLGVWQVATMMMALMMTPMMRLVPIPKCFPAH